jgi:hypothetical protein
MFQPESIGENEAAFQKRLSVMDAAIATDTTLKCDFCTGTGVAKFNNIVKKLINCVMHDIDLSQRTCHLVPQTSTV